MQTALDADRDGGATLQLLADVTGDYTIDGTKNTKLDLNGHSIKGTVTVKAAAGSNTTTLSNRKNTTTARIDKVVAHSGAELARPDKPAVIGTLTLAEGATWKTILSGKPLGYKVLNADGTHKWYARDDVNGSQLNNVIINILPITFEKLNLEVDGQHLITCRAGLLCKCKGFLFAAHFSVDIKINFSAFFPVQQSRNTADLKFLCFHRNISCQMPPSFFRYSGWSRFFTSSFLFIVIVPMITHFPFKHKQKEL